MKNEIPILKATIREAVAAGDKDSEATARVNLASILLQEKDPGAFAAFDDAMALVRQLRDQRRQGILYINFVPAFLEAGQKERALTNAQSAVQITKKGLIEHHILALLNLGDVWQKGFHDPIESLKAYRSVVEILEALNREDPEKARSLLKQLTYQLALVAKTAFDAGDMLIATSILKLLDPEKTKELEVFPENRKASIDIPTLQAMTDSRLDPVLAAWRTAKEQKRFTNAAENNPVLRRMRELAVTLGWKNVEDRLTRVPTLIHTRDASKGGPAGLLRLAEMVNAQQISFESIKETATKLAVPDEDLEPLGLFAFQDETLSRNGTAFTLWRLIAAVTKKPVLAYRFYDLLGMYSAKDGDYESALNYYLEGDQRLAVRGNKAERAHLRNEASIMLAYLRRNEQALDMAHSAEKMAEEAGDKRLAAKTTGNVGFVLMQLKRWQDAARVFERLAQQQASLDDQQGLANTRANLEACYIAMGRY